MNHEIGGLSILNAVKDVLRLLETVGPYAKLGPTRDPLND